MNVSDIAVEVAKATPPVACIICEYVSNVDNDIKLLTLIYIIMQIIYLIYKWARDYKAVGVDNADKS